MSIALGVPDGSPVQYDVAAELASTEACAPIWYTAKSDAERAKLLEDGVQCAPALYGTRRPKMRAKIWPLDGKGARQLEKSPVAATWVQRDGYWQNTATGATSWVRPDDSPPRAAAAPSASAAAARSRAAAFLGVCLAPPAPLPPAARNATSAAGTSCIAANAEPWTAPADRRLLFVGAGSTGSTSCGHLCKRANRSTLHNTRWQHELMVLTDARARSSRALKITPKLFMSLASIPSGCLLDGYARYRIDPLYVDDVLGRSNHTLLGGVERNVYVLNTRPLFGWLVSRLKIALTHSEGSYSRKQLEGHLRSATPGGATALDRFVWESVRQRQAKHAAVLARRAALEPARRLAVLDGTAPAGQRALLTLLGVPNATFPRANRAYGVGAVGGSGAHSPALHLHSTVDPSAYAAWNLSTLLDLQLAVASALQAKWPDLGAVGANGVCGCPEAEVAV